MRLLAALDRGGSLLMAPGYELAPQTSPIAAEAACAVANGEGGGC